MSRRAWLPRVTKWENLVKTGNIEVGDPVILINNNGLESYEFSEGARGTACSVVNMPDGGKYLGFLPKDGDGIYIISFHKFELDVREKERIDSLGAIGGVV